MVPRPRSRTPALPTDLDAYRAFEAEVRDFTDALRDGRCRRTNHFDVRLGETVAAFRPLFAPWNMEALFLLHVHGSLRFNALKRALAPVSARVLTDKLRHLEAHGLVARRAEGDAVTYALTPKGETVARHLHPLLFFLHNADALADGR